MRQKRTTQTSLFDPDPVDHPVGATLEAISAWLDNHPEWVDAVAADLGAARGKAVGRLGLSCETVLRCAVVRHLHRLSWRGLEFFLRDSRSTRRFVRLGRQRAPKKSALQATVGAVRAETWERLNRCLLEAARSTGVETGSRVRVDSTVTETHMLAPSDSRLLFDGIRVLTRLLSAARRHLGDGIAYRDHCRAAKRRALEARTQRGAEKRKRTYRKLFRTAVATLAYVDAARPDVAACPDPWAVRWLARTEQCSALLRTVIVQAARRVLLEENVPAAEKIVSLFEPHTDIVRKGGRETAYGHKINLATGRSGLVLDVVVERGNPADSARCLPMLERHCAHYGKAPSHVAFDGGYAAKENLKRARALGVAHAVFSKKRGLKADDMTPSSWVHDQLRRFRAGVEAGISYLKRCFGLDRCRWRGLPRFKAWVHSAVFTHNLVRLARLHPT